jgi:hypothetical protein
MVSALQLKPTDREATDFSVFTFFMHWVYQYNVLIAIQIKNIIPTYIKESGWKHIYDKEHKKAIDLLSFSVSCV